MGGAPPKYEGKPARSDYMDKDSIENIRNQQNDSKIKKLNDYKDQPSDNYAYTGGLDTISQNELDLETEANPN